MHRPTPTQALDLELELDFIALHRRPQVNKQRFATIIFILQAIRPKKKAGFIEILILHAQRVKPIQETTARR